MSNQWYIWGKVERMYPLASDVKNNQIYDKVLLIAEEIHEHAYWNRQKCGHGNKKQQQQQKKHTKKNLNIYIT